MNIKKGGYKWFFIAIFVGSITGLVCNLVEVDHILAITIPASVTAGSLFGLRSLWMESE